MRCSRCACGQCSQSTRLGATLRHRRGLVSRVCKLRGFNLAKGRPCIRRHLIACRAAGPGRCARAGAEPLAEQAGEDRRAHRAGQLAGPDRALDERQAGCALGPAGGGREQARRRRHARPGRGGQGHRRPHAGHRLQRADRLCAVSVSQDALRPGQGSAAGDHDHQPAQRAGGQHRQGAGQDRGRVRGLGQGARTARSTTRRSATAVRRT